MYLWLFFICKAFITTLFGCCVMQTCPLVYIHGKHIAWGLKSLYSSRIQRSQQNGYVQFNTYYYIKKNIHICTMMLKTDFAASYIFFIAYIFFRIPWSIERSKEQHFYEIEIFCNVLNFLICFTDYWIVGLSCFPQVG